MILAYSISWEVKGGREGDHYTAGGRESFARRIRQSPHATHNTPTHTHFVMNAHIGSPLRPPNYTRHPR